MPHHSTIRGYRLCLAALLLTGIIPAMPLTAAGENGLPFPDTRDSFYADSTRVTTHPADEKRTSAIIRARGKITIDGNLSEASWSQAQVIGHFWEKFPNNTSRAGKQTEVRILFDEGFIYIGARCADSGNYIIPSLKRDRSFYESDALAFIIDPYNKKTMAYYFSVTPYNTQSEDVLINNLFEDPSLSWDNKWFSATKINEDHWVAEIAIPFTILKYDRNQADWGINFFRNDRKSNEIHSWVNLPLQFKPWDLGYMGTLHWEDTLPRPGQNLFINPYVKTGVAANNIPGQKARTDWQAGFDLKTTIRNSMSLDLTVNPDFSQVEVDRQITNLSRFNLFFPERRGFFVENNDIFSGYAGGYIQPFYSRSIGLSETGNPLPIYGGIKLSGNVSSGLRAGVLNVLTKADRDNPAQNYSAISLNQKILKRSLIKGYFFNRESLGRTKSSPKGQYGRNAGLEFNYSDLKGKWNAWSGFHHSLKPGLTRDRAVIHSGFSYSTRKFSAIVDFADAGTNYTADMGFISRYDYYDEKLDSGFRQGFRMHYGKLMYNIYPKKGKIINHKFESSNVLFTNPDHSSNELLNAFRYCLVFRNSSEFRTRIDHQVVWLQTHTSFTPSALDEPITPGRYQFLSMILYYRTDARKKLSLVTQFRTGGFYNGTLTQSVAGLQYRVQPWGSFAVDLEYNRLKFPGHYGSAVLYMISPRMEINFSNNLFWTTFVQFNTQRNNLNINSRVQWRFKPMSDLYFVYTDNYYTDPFMKNKSRAFVLKLNYWLSK